MELFPSVQTLLQSFLLAPFIPTPAPGTWTVTANEKKLLVILKMDEVVNCVKVTYGDQVTMQAASKQQEHMLMKGINASLVFSHPDNISRYRDSILMQDVKEASFMYLEAVVVCKLHD